MYLMIHEKDIHSSIIYQSNRLKTAYTLWYIHVMKYYAVIKNNEAAWGTWVAQLVKCLTLDLGSGHDLTVCELKPHIGLCTDSSEPGACFGFSLSGRESLFPSLSASPLLVLCLSL